MPETPCPLEPQPAAPKPGVTSPQRAQGEPRHPSTGTRGTPRLGIPATYLAVPAPRPPACVPSHRGSAALCLVKPIMHRLYGSPSPQHPLLPRSGAWHGLGALGVPLAECGDHPYGRRKLHSGARSGLCPPVHPILGDVWSPEPEEESLSPYHKFHRSLGGSLPGWPSS